MTPGPYNHARAGTTSTREDRWWQESAACRGMSTDLFYGPDGEGRGPNKATREAEAKRVCHGCPVVEQCRDEVLRKRDRHGVWGALGEEDRDRLWRRSA
jgi:WhiB family redox-sensing transcriptional regulator